MQICRWSDGTTAVSPPLFWHASNEKGRESAFVINQCIRPLTYYLGIDDCRNIASLCRYLILHGVADELFAKDRDGK